MVVRQIDSKLLTIGTNDGILATKVIMEDKKGEGDKSPRGSVYYPCKHVDL